MKRHTRIPSFNYGPVCRKYREKYTGMSLYEFSKHTRLAYQNLKDFETQNCCQYIKYIQIYYNMMPTEEAKMGLLKEAFENGSKAGF